MYATLDRSSLLITLKGNTNCRHLIISALAIDCASTVEIRVHSEIRFILPIPQIAYEWVLVEKAWKTRNCKTSLIQRGTDSSIIFRYTKNLMKLSLQEEDPRQENDKWTRWSMAWSRKIGNNRLSRKWSIIIDDRWPNFHQSYMMMLMIWSPSLVFHLLRGKAYTQRCIIHETTWLSFLRTFSSVCQTFHHNVYRSLDTVTIIVFF